METRVIRTGMVLAAIALASGCGETSEGGSGGSAGQAGSGGSGAGGTGGSGGAGGSYQFPTECEPPLTGELEPIGQDNYYAQVHYNSPTSCEITGLNSGGPLGVFAVILGYDVNFEPDYHAGITPPWSWVSFSEGMLSGEANQDIGPLPEDTDISVVVSNPDGTKLNIVFRISGKQLTVSSISEG